MENPTTEKKPHAIIIPYPLQGHVIPSVHLATKLASHGFSITFINTHHIHRSLTTSANAVDGPADIFYGLGTDDIRHMTVSDGLPLGFDRSLNHDTFMEALLHVLEAHVEDAVARIVGSGQRVDILIADTFFVWTTKIARKFGLIHVSFWTEAALIYQLYYHLDLLRTNKHFDSPDRRTDTIDYIPGVRAIEPKDMTSYLQESDTTTVCHQIISKAFEEARGADFVLCNSVHELEPDTIDAINTKKPFYPIGPIFPPGFSQNIIPTSLWSESDCTQWLDTKPDGSVVYISFGSYAHVTKRDLWETAYGVLDSNVNFLWVLRPCIINSGDTEILPAGFDLAAGDRSMTVPWCSQRAVLMHRAVGGFLTHCGWNSVLEAVWCEVPLVCFPLLTDQFTNRKLAVDDWKIGINLLEKRPVAREEVSENVSRLMRGQSRDELRARIKDVKKTLEKALENDGSSVKNTNHFVEDLKAKIKSKKIG